MHRLLVVFLSFANSAAAESPNVVVDIAPLHSLVSKVMNGIEEPTLLTPPSASSHDFTLRPSEATALQGADILFWIGPEQTHWLERARTSLAPNATSVAMLALPETHLMTLRTGVMFEAHAHESEHDNDHDEHSEALDTHIWLDPINAGNWVAEIAKVLAEADPENAEAYKVNAARAEMELATLVEQLTDILAPHKSAKFITFHDAYQYFENRFAITATASVSLSDASSPGPARVREIRNLLPSGNIRCIFSEPQLDAGLIGTLVENTEIKTAELDPMGRNIPIGPEHYEATLKAMAEAIAGCLSE